MNCNRCKTTLTDATAESCWYCHAPLCFECWEEIGHCGHARADKQNEAVRAHHDEWEKTTNRDLANAAYRKVMETA